MIWNRPDILSVFSYLLSIICFGLVCILSNSIIVTISFVGSFTDEQSLYFIYFVLFTSGSVWLLLLLASITGVIPDFAIKLIDHVRETEKIKKLKAEYLRNAYYRNKTIKNKRPKFLKYITLPSFSNLTSLTQNNNNEGQNNNRGNGNSTTPKEKNKLTTYLKQISTTSKASMTNILNNNILKPNRSKQHTFTTNSNGSNHTTPSPLTSPISDINPEVQLQFTNLTKIISVDSTDQIEMSSIKSSNNNNEISVNNGSNRSSNSNGDNKKLVVTFSDILSGKTIDEEESEPKLKSIKPIEECEL